MMDLRIEEYSLEMKTKWDDFVMNKSVNGTFLQTKQFLNYHKNRFVDSSLVIYKGNDTIVAVIPACTLTDGEKKIFSAHQGSTFGGIVIGDKFYNIEHVDAIMSALDEYLILKEYDEVRLKCTSEIFARSNVNLLYYYMYQRGYLSWDEISCYIDFNNYNDDIIANFSSGRRRDYRYSLKHGLEFKRLGSKNEISDFYSILCENLEKFDTKPVHTLEELMEFKNERLNEIVEFYGVFHENKMIAGSMVFKFDKQVFHTQYLAASQDYLKMFPMNFMDTTLIQEAKKQGFRYFSFGTSTEEHGKVLNKHLAQFKEGFGTEYGLNRTFIKVIKR